MSSSSTPSLSTNELVNRTLKSFGVSVKDKAVPAALTAPTSEGPTYTTPASASVPPNSTTATNTLLDDGTTDPALTSTDPTAPWNVRNSYLNIVPNKIKEMAAASSNKNNTNNKSNKRNRPEDPEPHIISVEAAIGCGKSTLLGLLAKEFGKKIRVVYEPLEKWQNVEVGSLSPRGEDGFKFSPPCSPELGADAPLGDGLGDVERGGEGEKKEDETGTGKESSLAVDGKASSSTTSTAGEKEKTTSTTSENTKPKPPKPAKRQLRRHTTTTHLFQEEANKNFNALDLFYKSSRRFAYSFQGYVFMTRVQAIEKVIDELRAEGAVESTLVVVERSWITDTPTFFELLRDDNGVSEIEYRMLRNWLDWLIPKTPRIQACVYLRATTDCVMKRLNKRNRSEESTMDVNYQKKLIDKHDKLFLDKNLYAQETSQLELEKIDEDQPMSTSTAHDDQTVQQLNTLKPRQSVYPTGDYVVPATNNKLGLPCLIIDAEREFQHDEGRLKEVFSTIGNFLDKHGVIVPTGMRGQVASAAAAAGAAGETGMVMDDKGACAVAGEKAEGKVRKLVRSS